MEKENLARVAYYYYKGRKTQQEIAEIMNISRQKVNRDLQKALDLGIVHIEIDFPISTDIDLEVALENRYSLKKAVVVKGNSSDDFDEKLSKQAAEMLYKVISDDMCIGVTWGTTLLKTVNHLNHKRLKNVVIKQLVGGTNPEYPELNGENIARIFAEKCYGSFTALYLPAIVKDKETKRLLFEEEAQKNFSDISKCQLVLAGIGGLNDGNTLSKLGYLSKDEVEKMKEDGIVGDLGLIFYDKNGKPLPDNGPLYSLGYNIFEKPDSMKLMVVAGGKEKVSALKGILKSKIVNLLVTDEVCAREILGENYE